MLRRCSVWTSDRYMGSVHKDCILLHTNGASCTFIFSIMLLGKKTFFNQCHLSGARNMIIASY